MHTKEWIQQKCLANCTLFQISFQVERCNGEEGRESSETERSIKIEFTSNLHVIHPSPKLARSNVSGGEERTSDGYVTVYIPTSFLHHIDVTAQSPSSNGEEASYVLDMSDDKSTGHSGTWEKSAIQVAAGFEEHHDFVMTITILLSLLGAWRILYVLSKVSVWK